MQKGVAYRRLIDFALLSMSISEGEDKIKDIPNRGQSFVGVIRSLGRVYEGVAKCHGGKTAGAPKALMVAHYFCRLLGLGCPKQAICKNCDSLGYLLLLLF